MNLIESKEEPERAFYLRLLGNCGVPQPQLSHPSATSTEGHRPRNTHQGFSPLQDVRFINELYKEKLLTPPVESRIIETVYIPKQSPQQSIRIVRLIL
jgi:hypothetical protein